MALGRAATWWWARRGWAAGPRALLLPALSSISTRAEMAPLAARLAGRFTTLTIDWPGFGAAPKPAVAWSPGALAAFLRFALDEVAGEPALVVAAGHAAGYLLAEAAARPAPGGASRWWRRPGGGRCRPC